SEISNLSNVVNKNTKEIETSLSAADFAAAPSNDLDLSQLGIKTKVDPTMGNKSEGDIAIENVKKFVEANNKLGRNAIRQVYRRWPDGVVPYTLSSQYGPYSRSVIAKAMQIYHEKTCVKFVPRDPSTHRDYIYIQPDDGCYSLVGRTGGRQPLSLDSECIQTGTIVHELMHAIGFFHEQSRADRDQYIEIVWQNVMSGADDQFEKYGLNVLDHLDEPYDYSSIMHYGPYAFSDNGKRTIVARKAGAERMGQRIALSEIDLRKINKLYSCPQKSAHSVNDNATSSKPTMATTSSTIAECRDLNWRCPFWSMSVFNYCEKYPEIAYKTCIKSCGNCHNKPIESTTSTTTTTIQPSKVTPTNSNACQDLNPSCAAWANRGECQNPFQRRFMRVLCPESCHLCFGSEKPSTALDCDDIDSYFTCKIALIFDECGQKLEVCAKTCGAC
uniref:Metalloendopeptidase n=1 Tax=Ascaris lumbricoides TaxID=6252 RepID=A0A0M3IJB1_ASCLU